MEAVTIGTKYKLVTIPNLTPGESEVEVVLRMDQPDAIENLARMIGPPDDICYHLSRGNEIKIKIVELWHDVTVRGPPLSKTDEIETTTRSCAEGIWEVEENAVEENGRNTGPRFSTHIKEHRERARGGGKAT